MTGGQDVVFTDEGSTQQSGYEGREPKVGIRRDSGRFLVTAYQGQKSTGGYSIRIEKVTIGGTILRVRARLSEPAQGAFVSQALTSPAHMIGIPFGADLVILFDQDDKELARATP